MLSPEQFTSLMDEVVANQFPTTRLAYAETKEDVIRDLYVGKEEKYLAGESEQPGGADFEFAETVAAAAPTVISVLTVIKLAAEAYVAIRNALDSKEKAASSQAAVPEIDEGALREDLSQRLRRYVPVEKATAIVEQIIENVRTTAQA